MPKLNCCNPYNEENHYAKEYRKNLRLPSQSIRNRLPFIGQSDYLCQPCRKKIGQMNLEEPNINSDSDDDVSDEDGNDSDVDYMCPLSDSDSDDEQEYSAKLISELRDQFQKSETQQQKINILTLLNPSWSVRKTAYVMNTSQYLARKARELKDEYGILPTIPKKAGKALSMETVLRVKEFYVSEDISAEMPGLKDTKATRIDGESVHLQKRLILGNLKDIYNKFCSENRDIKIGLTKFCSFRPVNCILAGAGGTHNVCVCPIHENMNLMAKGSHMVTLMKKDKLCIDGYEDVLLILLCENPTESCFFGLCQKCPKDTNFNNILLGIFDKKNIIEICYKQWVSQPQATLKNMTVSTQVFVKNLCSYGRKFLAHSFIARKQATTYKHLKKNLRSDQCLVICDFAENYAFIIQNAVPGFHWNNNQATVFPIVFYHNNNGIIEHQTLIFISESKKHDAIAVYVFLEEFNKFLSSFNPLIRKCIYFSDGAPQQFKNAKNFSTIYFHEQDFGRSAEWHFHATAHGKGPCDGAGGAFKRKARKASLQMSAHITTPSELFEWAKADGEFSKISVFYKNEKNYDDTATFLCSRFESCSTISGTQKLHFVEPAHCQLRVKSYSSCPNDTIVSFVKKVPKRTLKRKAD